MKRFLVLLITAILSFNVFAQSGKTTGLTDLDVQAFCKNYESISAELDTFSILYNENLSDSDKANCNKVFNKYGIAGNNTYDKYKAIYFAYSINSYEASLDAESAALMKQMGIDPFMQYRTKFSEQDSKVVKRNLPALDKAFNNYNEVANNSSNSSSADMAAMLDLFGLGSSGGAGGSGSRKRTEFHAEKPQVDKSSQNTVGDFDNILGAGLGKAIDGYISAEDKRALQKKYNTKKRYKLVKYDGIDYVVIQPSEIVFDNSEDAEAFAAFYSGYTGKWTICNHYGYLGKNNKDQPFYVWVSGGVAYYSSFPVNSKTGNPDKFIPDDDVTDEIREQTILQIYRYKK